jgi:hypothetical protein
MFAMLFALISALIGTVPAPSPPDLTAFDQGQAFERLFQDHLMPGICGIVLERPRCVADFQTVQELRGPDPTDGAMQAWLSSGDLTLAVKSWNGTYIPDATWTEHPDFAWWSTAGQAFLVASLPVNAATSEYASHFADLLASHDRAAPAGFGGVLAATGTPFDRLRPLQAALASAILTAPYPTPLMHIGVRGDVQLGIYVSTLQELLDNPIGLSRPESRAFGLAVVRTLQDVSDRYNSGLSFSVVADALRGDIPEGPETDALRESLSAGISTKAPLAERQAFVIGALTAQLAYNAAVLRDARIDAGFRGALASIPAYGGMSSQVRTDLEALKKIPTVANGGGWDAINTAASRATAEMASSP